MMFTVSVITINKDNKGGLDKTINSVISQAGADFEYIVIDGNSTDGSVDVIRNNNDGITWWISEKDEGVYHAMNKGIGRATGEYCLFLNSGDYLYSSEVMNKFINSGFKEDIVTGNAIVVSEGNDPEPVNSPDEISFYVFFRHTILHQATFIRRELFIRYGLYNTQYKIIADWEWFVRVLFIHNSVYRHFPFTVTVFDGNGMSSMPDNRGRIKDEREIVLMTLFPYLLKDYNLLSETSVYHFLSKIRNRRVIYRIFIIFFKIFNRVFPD